MKLDLKYPLSDMVDPSNPTHLWLADDPSLDGYIRHFHCYTNGWIEGVYTGNRFTPEDEGLLCEMCTSAGDVQFAILVCK